MMRTFFTLLTIVLPAACGFRRSQDDYGGVFGPNASTDFR